MQLSTDVLSSRDYVPVHIAYSFDSSPTQTSGCDEAHSVEVEAWEMLIFLDT